MRVVHKYKLDRGVTELKDIPKNHKLLFADLDLCGNLCVWIELNTKTPWEYRENVVYEVFGTGEELPKDGIKHVGSVVSQAFVWHIYRSVREINEK
jgi:hypothetical protein